MKLSRLAPGGPNSTLLHLTRPNEFARKSHSLIWWRYVAKHHQSGIGTTSHRVFNLYGLNENRLVCLNAKDGSLKWRGDKFGYGQIIAASGHLIILGDAGDLALVEMNPNEFVLKAKFKALEGGRTWNYPALYQGLLFVRNSYEMACYDLRIK